jgi:hypothetical protein
MATNSKNWKKSNVGQELNLPSGNVALVKNPGIQHFIKEGMIPNALLPIVQNALGAGGITGEKAKEMTQDLSVIAEIMQTMDAITVACVVDPPILSKPATEAERDPELLYVDEVDDADKTFIFQFALGGTKDLEKFRKQQDDVMDDISRSEAMGNTSE